MSDFTYLAGPLVRVDFAEQIEDAARRLLSQGIDPSGLDVLAETLARAATHLGKSNLDAATLLPGLEWLEPSEPLVELLEVAFKKPRRADEVAALAVHLVDVGERLALLIFLPELPALTARADRTGGAARSVGVARHLKG